MNGHPGISTVNDAAVLLAFRAAIATEVANMGYGPDDITERQTIELAATLADRAHKEIHHCVESNMKWTNEAKNKARQAHD